MRAGLDYSADRISGADIKAAGYDFVVRYLWFPGQGLSYLTANEHVDLTENGVEDHAVYEQGTNDPAGGYDGGHSMGVQAVESAKAARLPADRTIFFCADAWLKVPVAVAMAFLDGSRDALAGSGYVHGAYGFTDFIYAAQDGGHAERFWLCGAESGVREGIHLYQWNNGNTTVAGVTCDINKMYQELGTKDDAMEPDERNAVISTHAAIFSKGGDQGDQSIIERLVEAQQVGRANRAALERLEAKVDALTAGGGGVTPVVKVPTAEENAAAVIALMKKEGN